ncbi:hypothetical protein [Aquiflexum sp.]|uniref:hypothetical protein n=1 Tax=Aquiflexum sp. TaxID=1872584 RepID=UPI00359397EC
MSKRLKAGHLELLYEEGFLRYIKLGGHEVIRMIYHAVRDQNWGTIPMTISNEFVHEGGSSFEISYDASFQQSGIDFQLQCHIKGTSDSEIFFDYRGVAQTSFKRNRIGFLILHPISTCIGQPVKIGHTEGSHTDTRFPVQISPYQPFMNIAEMTWPIGSNWQADLKMEGETFEAEDQRNWTDASYKTYCTPLGIPFPVTINQGEIVEQRVSLAVMAKGENRKTALPIQRKITFGETVPFPKIGTVISQVPSAMSIQLLKTSGIAYTRVELSIDNEIKPALEILIKIQSTGLPVELAIFTDNPFFVDKVAEIKEALIMVKSILLLPNKGKTTSQEIIDAIPRLRDLLPGVEVFAGTDAFFAELNRFPLDHSNLDGVSYSINPQVHAFDNRSLIETLEAQSYTVTSAKKLFPNKEIKVSPISFHMRWNPNATDPSIPARFPTGLTDQRQFTFFGACWWLISWKYMAESKVDSITYFELTGENGFFSTINNQGDEVTFSPMFLLLKEVLGLKPAKIKVSKSTDPLVIDTIVFEIGTKMVCMAVNWSEESKSMNFPQGFKPTRFTTGADPTTGELVWKSCETMDSSTFTLQGNSLTELIKS